MIFGLGFIIGTILGSAVLAIAERSLSNRTFFGRSSCPHCRHKLNWKDLFPLLSYLFLGGKCRYCKKKIDIEHLLVEVSVGLLIGLLFLLSFNNSPNEISLIPVLIFTLELILKAFFISVLSAIFITDIRKYLIPDRIILPAIKIAILLILATIFLKVFSAYYPLAVYAKGAMLSLFADPFLTAVGIGGFFLSLILITRGKGMGGGDVKLGFLMGLVLGFPQGPIAVMLSFLLGSLYAVPLLLLGKKSFGESIAFGPFLVLGSLLMLFWGDQILYWYLSQNLLTNSQ